MPSTVSSTCILSSRQPHEVSVTVVRVAEERWLRLSKTSSLFKVTHLERSRTGIQSPVSLSPEPEQQTSTACNPAAQSCPE